MKAYVGVTDTDWYRYLADRPGLDEVNFWRPGGAREFGVLAAGEPFLFKTHYPQNQVVGGAVFSGFVPLHVSEAWEFYGEGNGVGSLTEMRARIGRYRKQPIGPHEDPMIGCVLLRGTRFFPSTLTADPPPGFAPSIVQGKGYDSPPNPPPATSRSCCTGSTTTRPPAPSIWRCRGCAAARCTATRA